MGLGDSTLAAARVAMELVADLNVGGTGFGAVAAISVGRHHQTDPNCT